MKNKFKRNDVVRSITGGPTMTVIEYYVEDAEGKHPKETSLVKCQWFDTQDKLRTEKFEEDTLQFA